MDLLKLLSESLEDRFKANAIIEGTRQVIQSKVSEAVYGKYRGVSIFNEKLEYKLAGVDVSVGCPYSYNVDFIDVELVYFCVSKLPKQKRERVEKARRDYLDGKGLRYNTYKIPLWNELRYRLKPEDALAGKINLNIEWNKHYQ